MIGNFRWVICAVLLFGTTKNYMDRQVIGILKNSLQHQFGWSELAYGNLVFSFQAAYALGMVVVGRLVDALGTRLGYALAMTGWSMASMTHGLMNSLSRDLRLPDLRLVSAKQACFPPASKR
jgi:MFS transporter, ACS family, hexuronate transporter